MKKYVLGIIAGIIVVNLNGCTPLPRPDQSVTTECQFAREQTSDGLRATCSVTGSPTNVLIDPMNSANRNCSVTSVSLYNQHISMSATLTYGENNEDGDYLVRIGVDIENGNHTANAAKSVVLSSCTETIGPIVNIETSFSGKHIVYIDKTKVPMCVYQSRYNGITFSQTGTESMTGIEGDLSFATKAATEEAIARQIDLEAARAVNRLLGLGSSLNDAFEARSGRCQDDYRIFNGN